MSRGGGHRGGGLTGDFWTEGNVWGGSHAHLAATSPTKPPKKRCFVFHWGRMLVPNRAFHMPRRTPDGKITGRHSVLRPPPKKSNIPLAQGGGLTRPAGSFAHKM